MSKRVTSRVVSVGLFATVIMLSTNYATATLAADDCLAGPNRPPAAGGHWYYRLDHVNNRKCWYLVEPEARTPTAEAAEPQPSPDPAPQPPPPPQPTFGSFFSSLSTGFTGWTQPNIPNSDVRSAQTAHPDDLKDGEASSGRQPRMVRHPDAEAALAPKPHRPAHARPPAEHAEERPAPQLNQAERDALFQEFLRWRESQAR
jgi:hypothetical protein